jgi:starvation-inducible DNA-binding protein
MQQQQQPKNLSMLSRVLSDTFILYMKTYAVHWNYTGANFFSIHKMTEAQYAELAEAVDEIAERVRALGHETPISLDDILDDGDLNEIKSGKISSSAMLEDLAKSHDLLAKRAKEAADAADAADDDYSNDMMVGRIGAHQKAAWMLKSLLKS